MLTVLKIWVLVNVAVFALAISVRAAPLTVTDEEQKTVLIVCRIAAKSPVIGDEDTAGIAQFCVAWKAKMLAAEAAVKAEPKVEVEPK